MVSVRNGHLRCPGAAAMPKMGLCDEVKWSLVCVPLAVFLVVTAAAFWSMTIIPQQRALHLDVDQGHTVPTLSSAFDCDVCVVLYTGDDGSTKPSETNLPACAPPFPSRGHDREAGTARKDRLRGSGSPRHPVSNGTRCTRTRRQLLGIQADAHSDSSTGEHLHLHFQLLVKSN
jgi:hypothetical protein